MKKRIRYITSLWIISGIIVVIILLSWLWLPGFIYQKTLTQLERITDYHATADHTSVSIFKGRYGLHDIKLMKKDSKVPVAFFEAKTIKFSLDWSSLLSFELVSKVTIDEPVLNYVSGPDAVTSQLTIDTTWSSAIQSMAIAPINSFLVTNGTIRYHNYHSTPPLELQLTNVRLYADNLTDIHEKEKLLPAKVTGSAALYDGTITLDIDLNPMLKTPLFTISANLQDLTLTHLNSFFNLHHQVDVTQGKISLDVEASVKDHTISAKTILTKDNVSTKTIADARAARTDMNDALKGLKVNHVNNDFLEITYQGEVKQQNLWAAVGNVLSRTFTTGLSPLIQSSQPKEKSIRKAPSSPRQEPLATEDKKEKKGFLKKLFKGKNKKSKQQEEG